MRQGWLTVSFLIPACLSGQDAGSLKLQFHGSVVQGGLLGSHNNYMSATTSEGSTQWTEAAINLSASFSDSLRAGLQFHTYRLGELGQLKIDLDWAYGDYRIQDWLGIRAGKVKTPLGLFNDTQDIDNLHLWCLLPQGVYPADNRSWTLAHTGGDVYGRVRLPAGFGKLLYRGYFGSRTADSDGGYLKNAAEFGIQVKEGSFGRLYGGDLRWRPPVRGLTAGASVGMADVAGQATILNVPFPVTIQSTSDTNTSIYAEFDRGKFYAAGEFRRRIWNLALVDLRTPLVISDSRAWYLMGAYRIHPKVNVGAYYSHFAYAIPLSIQRNWTDDHSNDWVVATRIDPNPYFYLKFEVHYLDGTALGFYTSTNPAGFDRLTRLLAARIGFSF